MKSDKPLKEDILQTAERLFKEYGYDDTTFQMIAEALGITRGAIVYHFKNKYLILHTLFENYFAAVHAHMKVYLPEGVNYYEYYCIFYIYISKEITKNERNYALFYHKGYSDSWEHEKLWDVEHSYKLITDNFNKDFSREELRLATVMDMGARTSLFHEFAHGDGVIQKDKYSYYRIYLMGVLSRLDEATIQKNIDRAFAFVREYPMESMYLLS